MLGMGHRLDRLAKQKIISEKAHDYNTKYDHLTTNGFHPDEAVNTLTAEDFQRRHQA